jgi:transposase
VAQAPLLPGLTMRAERGSDAVNTERNGEVTQAEALGGPGLAPDPETVVKAARRQFTAEYKLRVLAEADGCTKGEIGALLRREGLYSSHLTDWRRQRAEGALAGLRPKKRGRRGQDPATVRIAQLERENRQLRDKLERAQLVIEVQGKVSRLLGIPPRSLEHEDKH